MEPVPVVTARVTLGSAHRVLEVAREPAPALSTWWRDHVDPHMRALTAADGTFAGCVATRHETVHQQQPSWAATPTGDGQFHTDPDSPRQPRRVTAPTAKEA